MSNIECCSHKAASIVVTTFKVRKNKLKLTVICAQLIINDMFKHCSIELDVNIFMIDIACYHITINRYFISPSNTNFSSALFR